LEKGLNPSSGLDLVPSGKIIKDVPLAIFLDPLFITVLKLLNLFDRFK
jgi:hypothetical protein